MRMHRTHSAGNHTPQPSTLAAVMKAEEPDNEAAPVEPRQAEKPLLKAWPPGYEKGSFRLVPGGVLLSAEGMPVLMIEEGNPANEAC